MKLVDLSGEEIDKTTHFVVLLDGIWDSLTASKRCHKEQRLWGGVEVAVSIPTHL